MKDTHPKLFRDYVIFAVGSILLGLNMFLLTPAFMPLSLDKWVVGLVFLGCGVIKTLILIFGRSNHKWLRLSMSLSVLIYSSWAVFTTYDFFASSLTSLQLPIFCLIVALLGLSSLPEPFTNPATGKTD